VAESTGKDADTTTEVTNDEIVPERSEYSAAVSDGEEPATEREDEAIAKRDKAPVPEDASAIDDAAEASEPQR
jgi:hypothetical protein